MPAKPVLSNQEYVRSLGVVCPVCQSDNITGGDITVNEGFVLQDVYCSDCESEWTDRYKLIGYDSLEIHAKK